MTLNDATKQKTGTAQTEEAGEKEERAREAGAADDALIPLPANANGLTAFERLVEILEEELWLQNHRSPHTRRAYREDVKHFMRTFGIQSREQLRTASRASVIAWVRRMEQDGEMPRTVCRRLAALSSLFNHLVEQQLVATNPVHKVKRPSVKQETGVTAAFDRTQAKKLMDAPQGNGLEALRDRAILSLLLQAGPRRAEIARLRVKDLHVKDLHVNKGYPSLRSVRKGGVQHSVTLHPQTAGRIKEYLDAAGHGEALESPLFRAVRPNWKTKRAQEQRQQEQKPEEARFLDPDTIDRILRKYVKAALELPRGFSAHSCRATFATTALENKCPLEDVQRTLGHADSRTTKLYDKRGDDPERSATFFANY